MLYRYAFNNALHHHVESIINSCLESRNSVLVDHLFEDCSLLEKILQTDKQPTVSGSESQVDFSEVTDFLLFDVYRSCKFMSSCSFIVVSTFSMEYEYIQ